MKSFNQIKKSFQLRSIVRLIDWLKELGQSLCNQSSNQSIVHAHRSVSPCHFLYDVTDEATGRTVRSVRCNQLRYAINTTWKWRLYQKREKKAIKFVRQILFITALLWIAISFFFLVLLIFQFLIKWIKERLNVFTRIERITFFLTGLLSFAVGGGDLFCHFWWTLWTEHWTLNRALRIFAHVLSSVSLDGHMEPSRVLCCVPVSYSTASAENRGKATVYGHWRWLFSFSWFISNWSW